MSKELENASAPLLRSLRNERSFPPGHLPFRSTCVSRATVWSGWRSLLLLTQVPQTAHQPPQSTQKPSSLRGRALHNPHSPRPTSAVAGTSRNGGGCNGAYLLLGGAGSQKPRGHKISPTLPRKTQRRHSAALTRAQTGPTERNGLATRTTPPSPLKAGAAAERSPIDLARPPPHRPRPRAPSLLFLFARHNSQKLAPG